MNRRRIFTSLLALGLTTGLSHAQQSQRRLPETFSLRYFRTNGIRVRAAVEGTGPLVILVHGFPELWYSWRHQIRVLAQAGYRVVAPDVRGYGGSDRPKAVEAYDMAELTADVIGLIDALGEESAILIGHDWGAQTCWNTAFLHPARVSAVAGISIPPVRRGEISAIETFRRSFEGRFFYQLYFLKAGVAEAELEADVRTTLRKIYFNASGDRRPEDFEAIIGKGPEAGLLDGMRDPEVFPDWLTDEDLDCYVQALAESGFRGALNRYRAQQRDWEILPQLSDLVIHQPSCFIAGPSMACAISGSVSASMRIRILVRFARIFEARRSSRTRAISCSRKRLTPSTGLCSRFLRSSPSLHRCSRKLLGHYVFF